MTLTHRLSHCTLIACAIVVLLAGCAGGGSALPSLSSAQPPNQTLAHSKTRSVAHAVATTGYVYVSNHAQNGVSQLLVYRLGLQNSPPMRTVTQGLVEASSVAVDASGNVYVANGSGGNVVEYSPGATSIAQTYSLGLVHPVGVTIANNTLYVADQGSNGYGEQILEYTVGDGTPLIGIGGLGGPSQLNEGIAVNPVEKEGPFYVSASSLTGAPPVGCPGTNVAAKNINPILWLILSLSNNQQAWGMAFDSKGRLYVADPCKNAVVIYVEQNYTWAYAGYLPGTFSAPMFLTINNDMLAIPNARGIAGSSTGYVTVVDLANHLSTVTITNGLEHPVGAAVASGS